MKYTPHPYQDFATQHIIDNPITAVSGAGLFLDMGLGKTVSTLTAIDKLIYNSFEVSKVLVIAPKRVAESTWSDEVEKWDHLKHLRLSLILGSEKQRKEAIAKKADIYVINRDNVPWLVTYFQGAWPYDMVVVDELSSFKSNKATRFKSLRRIRPLVNRMVGLTGTPAPNGMIDLWSQVYLLDQGKRLGENITGYREAYFHAPYKHNNTVVSGYKLIGEKPGNLAVNPSAKVIFEKIKDICISMSAKDWLDLPERLDTTTEIALSKNLMKQYYDFEKEKVMELIEATEGANKVNAVNAAVLTGKLLQFANGALYVDDKHNYAEIHNEKIEALGERIEAANGNPVLVFYQFQSDVARICKHLKSLKPHLLNGTKDLVDWNAKKIPFALGHPASFGHGLNMQKGGHFIEWFGLPWSLELVMQAVARLDRQGQTESVINNRLLVRNTMDTKVLDALEGKSEGQNALMVAVKALIKKYKG